MKQSSLDLPISGDADETLPQVKVYTDGGCDPNPGPGGWGAIIQGHTRESGEGWEWMLSGNASQTTNNRMELQAAAAALAILEGMLGRCEVHLYTDSRYLQQGITQWLDRWIAQGWRTTQEEAVKNQDLWHLLARLIQAHDVTWHWVQGHAGDPLNERADRLATEAHRAIATTASATDVPSPGVSLAADRSPHVEVFVKASYHTGKQCGGWGAVLRAGEHTRTLSGHGRQTSANALLIQAATAALNALNKPCTVTVYSDAKYLILGASRWVAGWQARGWQTRDGKPVANRAAWEALLQAARPHRITWVQVRAEQEIPADLVWAGQLAVEASRQSVCSGGNADGEAGEQ